MINKTHPSYSKNLWGKLNIPSFSAVTVCMIMNLIQSLLNQWQYLMSRQNIYSWLKRKKTHTTYFWQLQRVECCKILLLTACLANRTLRFLPGATSVQLQKRMDGGSGLCSGSAHCPLYYCERCEFYLLAGYKHYGLVCLFSSVKPLQQLAPPRETVAGRSSASRRPVCLS